MDKNQFENDYKIENYGINSFHKKPRLLGAKSSPSFHLQINWIATNILIFPKVPENISKSFNCFFKIRQN